MGRMTQAQVRASFIKAYPGVRRRGRGGYWYRCAKCGKWCGRPGKEGAYIREDEKMEVDHILPWSKTHCDSLGNLQALCKPCNRKKSNNQTGFETVKAVAGVAMRGDLLGLCGGALVTSVERKLGIKEKRR